MPSAARAHLQSVPSVPPTDEELVWQAVEGSRHAFGELFRRHSRYVAGVAFRMLGNRSSGEVDDIVQETFIAAHQGLEQLKDVAALRRWLVTIAVRRVHRRLGSARHKNELDWEVSGATDPSVDPRDTALVDDLYEALDQIDPELRIPWLLAKLEGHKLDDVALECGVSLATTKRRIALADERIRRRLENG